MAMVYRVVGIDLQQAKDYTPSHALAFLRYYQQGWQDGTDIRRSRWFLMQTGDLFVLTQ